jgi:hypothetical protein
VIQKIPNLLLLDLSGNSIESFPSWLKSFANTNTLLIDNNPYMKTVVESGRKGKETGRKFFPWW